MSEEFVKALSQLYADQKALKPDGYLDSHSKLVNATKNRINSFEIYRPYVGNSVLDWGCRHAIDSCLVRMTNAKAKIEGCDFCEGGDYRLFYEFAGLNFQKLEHHFKLPYPDDNFDTVIGGGVFEHVPFDDETIKELWRVLKPGGHLVMTYLPNKLSYTEALHRMFGSHFHRKLFSPCSINEYLLHNGFVPQKTVYHQMVPTQLGGMDANRSRLMHMAAEAMWGANYFLERFWPLNRLSTNLIVISKKVKIIP